MFGAFTVRGKGVIISGTVALFVAIAASNASAARLGHPSYSATGATPSLTQYNLLCDPPGATSGSTSTLYDPTIASLNTITAEPGFQITEVDVLIFDGEGTSPDQFLLPPGTTTFDFALQEVFGVQAGAVQVFWSLIPVGDAATKNTTGSGGGDTNTHTITFDNVSGDPKAIGVFTNYANGNSNFPDFFNTPDQYSGVNAKGQRFTYTAQQIAAETAKIHLKEHGDGDGDGDGDGGN